MLLFDWKMAWNCFWIVKRIWSRHMLRILTFTWIFLTRMKYIFRNSNHQRSSSNISMTQAFFKQKFTRLFGFKPSSANVFYLWLRRMWICVRNELYCWRSCVSFKPWNCLLSFYQNAWWLWCKIKLSPRSFRNAE